MERFDRWVYEISHQVGVHPLVLTAAVGAVAALFVVTLVRGLLTVTLVRRKERAGPGRTLFAVVLASALAIVLFELIPRVFPPMHPWSGYPWIK